MWISTRIATAVESAWSLCRLADTVYIFFPLFRQTVQWRVESHCLSSVYSVSRKFARQQSYSFVWSPDQSWLSFSWRRSSGIVRCLLSCWRELIRSCFVDERVSNQLIASSWLVFLPRGGFLFRERGFTMLKRWYRAFWSHYSHGCWVNPSLNHRDVHSKRTLKLKYWNRKKNRIGCSQLGRVFFLTWIFTISSNTSIGRVNTS